MVCSGAGFPKHCELYVVYCTSLVNCLAVVILSRRGGTARPSYQRTAEPSHGGGTEDYDGTGNVRNFAQRSPWDMRFFNVQ
jgi:hypothetical protein